MEETLYKTQALLQFQNCDFPKTPKENSPMKRRKQIGILNPFDRLSDEIVFFILDLLSRNPLDRKSFSQTCKSFHTIESKHRKTLKPFRTEHLRRVLSRYPNTAHLDLTLCPRVTDRALHAIAGACGLTLRSVDLSRSGFFTAYGLQSLVVSCRNLLEIDLSNATELRDSAAAKLSEAKNLEKLWLGRCKKITDIGLGCIAVGCRKLKLISLKWCLGVGDLGVGLIAVKCKEIRSLDLSYLPITKKCLAAILNLQHLKDLVLEGCFGIDDDSLLALRNECKSLKKLDMSSCENITHTGLSSLLKGAGCMQQLTLSHGSSVISSDIANSLKKLPMLQSITLDGCFVTSEGLKSIGECCNSLKELSLSKSMGVTDEGLSFLVTKLKDLKRLDLTCCRKITDVSVTTISNSCTRLTSLKMESCSLVPREAFVLIGQKCRFLEEIDLTDNEVDDEGLKAISKCSVLSSLKVGICLNITDKGLIHIGMSCSNLREVDLYRSVGITDSGISIIACGCPDLEMINIAYCKEITDKSLVSLSKCSRLNTLESRGCPLITSLGLGAIAVRCRQLTKLDIKKCQRIDDLGMLPLAQFSRNLKQINLSYSSVTDLGLLSLARISCLQSLTILHLDGLTPRGLSASLLACGALTKVKLHASFKSLLPQPLFKHLEARGCAFQWRDKIFQAELDPKCWKQQLEDVEH